MSNRIDQPREEDVPPAAQVPARSYRVEALSMGLELLSVFRAEGPALGVKDLVELSGIPMPTALQLVSTLEEKGVVRKIG